MFDRMLQFNLNRTYRNSQPLGNDPMRDFLHACAEKNLFPARAELDDRTLERIDFRSRLYAARRIRRLSAISRRIDRLSVSDASARW